MILIIKITDTVVKLVKLSFFINLNIKNKYDEYFFQKINKKFDKYYS